MIKLESLIKEAPGKVTLLVNGLNEVNDNKN
jgi:hypothetical protein